MKKNYKAIVVVFIGLLILLLISFWYQNSKVETFYDDGVVDPYTGGAVSTSDSNSEGTNTGGAGFAADSFMENINSLENTYNTQLNTQLNSSTNTDNSQLPSTDNFNPNIDITSDGATGLQFDSSMYLAPKNTDIKSRPCAVYYINNANTQINDTLHALCDQGFFDKPVVAMKVRQNYLEAKKKAKTLSTTAPSGGISETAELYYILNYYNQIKPKLPNGTCKVDFSSSGWVEPTKDSTGQIYPRKDAGSPATQSRGIPKDWAMCFKKLNTIGTDSINNVATQTASQLANNSSILSTGHVVQPFGDNNSYTQVAFNALTLYDFIKDANAISTNSDSTYLNRAVCAAGTLAPVKGLPADGSFMCIQLNENAKIVQFNPVVYNSTTQSMTLISDPTQLNTIFAQLFTLQQEGNSINLVPEKYSATLYTLQTDICINPANKANLLSQSGRIMQVTKTTPVIFDLINTFGVPIQTLWTTTGPTDVSYVGNNPVIQTLQASLANLLGQSNAAQTKLSQDVKPATSPILQQGLLRTLYSLKSPSWGGDSSSDMDKLLTNTNISVKKGSDTSPSYPAYYSNDQHYARVFDGYITVPETGPYIFMINSDDGGDIMITTTDANGNSQPQIVATYYGGHWVSYGGTNSLSTNPTSITLTQGQYYPIRVRQFQWEGPGGLQLLWLRPSRANQVCTTGPNGAGNNSSGVPKIQQVNKCFEEIPKTAYSYNSDPAFLAQIQKQSQYSKDNTVLNNIKMQISRVNQAIAALTNPNLQNAINNAMSKIIGNIFDGIDFANISHDGNFYFYIGAFSALTGGTINAYQSIVPLQLPTVNICAQKVGPFPSPVNAIQIQNGQVQYSVAFWIRIDDLVNTWRNILFHGAADDWRSNGTIDRTPGIWIVPNSTSIHFSQRSRNNVNPWTSLQYAPGLNKWYHFIAIVNNNTTQFYINGQLTYTATLSAGDKYIWNQQNKQLFVNNSPPRGESCTTSVLINNLTWYNYNISPTEINILSGQLPYEKTVSGLLATIYKSGTYTLMYNNNPINLFVYVDPQGTKWILILLYNHKGGTNPNLNPIKSGNFPIPQNNTIDNIPVGRDESNTPAWGHVAPSYLQNFSISEMAFWATGGSKPSNVINFRTSDSSVISYAATGKGHFNTRFSFNPGSLFTTPQNTSIPANGPNYFQDQGDIALTEFPFWRWGQSHWGIRGMGYRWEVDDYSGSNPYGNNTLHMVFIR